ncbi:MAG TPA: hypothetical protein VN922_04470, partial [Bacteroidia bacterium]|nr:hypothetical protein [Bacteroidia bacterium]
MKPLYKLIAIFGLLATTSHAQSWSFAERYLMGSGGYVTNPFSITTDYNGNVINTGDFQDTLAIGPFILRYPQPTAICSYVSKYSSSGKPLWIKGIYPGKNNTNYTNSYSVGADPSGNIYLAGSFSDTILIESSTASFIVNPYNLKGGYFLVKLDMNGNIIWLKTGQYYATVGNHFSQNLIVDKNANVYVCGLFNDSLVLGSYTLFSANTVNPSVFLAKYDSSGNVLWATQSKIPNQSITTLGSTMPGIALDNQNNIYISGSFTDSITFDMQALYCKYSNASNMFLAKYDGNNGKAIWARCPSIKSSNDGVNSWANMETRASVATDSYGNIYIASNFYDTLSFGPYTIVEYCTRTSGRYGGAFVVKYSGAGNPLWAESVRTKVPTQSSTSFALCSNGWNNFYLAGATEDSIISFGGLSLGPNPKEPYFLFEFDTGGHATCGALLNYGLRYINLAASPITPSVYVNADLLGGIIFGKDTLDGTYNSCFLTEFECDTCKMKIHFNGNVAICKGQSEVLSSLATGLSYVWSNGSSDSTIIVSPSNTTVYSVYFTNGTCYGDTNLTVTVLPIPTPSVTAKQNICIGDSVTITASGGKLFTWNNGDSTAAIVVKPTVTTVYTVSVSNGTCSAKDSSSVVVYYVPLPLVSNTQ